MKKEEIELLQEIADTVREIANNLNQQGEQLKKVSKPIEEYPIGEE